MVAINCPTGKKKLPFSAHRGCGISSLAKDLLTQMLASQPTRRIRVEIKIKRSNDPKKEI